MTKINCDMGESFGIYNAGNDEEIMHLIKQCDFKDGYVYYQASRGVDDIRSHIYKDSISIETFGYIVHHSFKSQSLKVMFSVAETTKLPSFPFFPLTLNCTSFALNSIFPLDALIIILPFSA